MTKNIAIAISISLSVIYIITLACLGIFGDEVSKFFMLWVPTALKNNWCNYRMGFYCYVTHENFFMP